MTALKIYEKSTEVGSQGQGRTNWRKLGSVAGLVIQANGRLTFEDDLRSGGLLYFTTQ